MEADLKYDHIAMEYLLDDSTIYARSSITVSMAIVLMMSFVICHKLTKRTFDDLLHLLNIFLGGTVALTRGYVDRFFTKSDIYRDIFSHKCNDPNIISDVTNGRLYKKMLSETNGQKVISFGWNTDGVSIFRSSNLMSCLHI